MPMPSDKNPFYNIHVEVLLEQVRLVVFFALGRVSTPSYLQFLQHFQPHILWVCLFYIVKFPAHSSWLYDPLNKDIFLSPGFCVNLKSPTWWIFPQLWPEPWPLNEYFNGLKYSFLCLWRSAVVQLHLNLFTCSCGLFVGSLCKYSVHLKLTQNTRETLLSFQNMS